MHAYVRALFSGPEPSAHRTQPVNLNQTLNPEPYTREQEAVLEIKCPYSQRIYPEIPPHYMDQVLSLLCS
jgi:hypothetical protein